MKNIKFPLQSQYPKRIYFSTECYRIRFKKKLSCYGLTDSDAKVITIKDGLSPRALMETFVHELLHVIEFERPVKMKHKTVYKFERAIMQLLMDNFL